MMNYRKGFPEVREEEFPKFELIDANSDGKIVFDEWLLYMGRK